MKRLLSILLALSLIISIAPAAFAADGEPLKQVYEFRPFEGDLSAGSWFATDKAEDNSYKPYKTGEDGTVYYAKAACLEYTTDRNWKLHDVSVDLLKADIAKPEVSFSLNEGGYLYVPCGTSYINAYGVFSLSLREEKTGFYFPSISIRSPETKNIGITLNLKDSNSDSEENFVSVEAVTQKNTKETYYSNKAIYTEEEKNLIAEFSTSLKRRVGYYDITLTEVQNAVLKITADNAVDGTIAFMTTDEDKTATVNATVDGDNCDPMPIGKDFVRYTVAQNEENPVITFDASTGVITAGNTEGTAIITAESPDGEVASNPITVTVTAPAAPEKTDLETAFEVDDTDDNYTYVAPKMTGLTIGGKVINAKLTANGYSIEAPAEDEEGDKFLYWAKGMETKKKIISFSNKLEGYVPENSGNNFVIAVYEGDIADTETPEYYNIDGQLIAKSNTAPAYPSIPGLGTAIKWEDCGGNIKVAKYADMERDNVTVTVDGKSQTVPYGTTITCTADSTKDNFKCWTKSGINGKEEIVSVDSTYTFKAWETCTVTAVYGEHTSIRNAMKIIIDSFTVGSETGVMAEFIGLDNAVEKGIMFTATGETEATKIAMTTKGNQFTVIADEKGTYKGYAIIGNATDAFTLITDGSYTK